MLLTRRGVLFGVTGVGVLRGAVAGAAQQRASSSAADTEIEKQSLEALQAIGQHLRTLEAPAAIGTIREAQRMFLRANQRFPEFIEIGIGVWEDLYDWHVRTQQPLTIVRLNDGRYGMSTLLSTLVLSVGAAPTYIGPGSAAV